MYGEIATLLVNTFVEKIREGKIYEIRWFVVSPSKNWYMPVECDLMVRFG